MQADLSSPVPPAALLFLFLFHTLNWSFFAARPLLTEPVLSYWRMTMSSLNVHLASLTAGIVFSSCCAGLSDCWHCFYINKNCQYCLFFMLHLSSLTSIVFSSCCACLSYCWHCLKKNTVDIVFSSCCTCPLLLALSCMHMSLLLLALSSLHVGSVLSYWLALSSPHVARVLFDGWHVLFYRCSSRLLGPACPAQKAVAVLISCCN